MKKGKRSPSGTFLLSFPCLPVALHGFGKSPERRGRLAGPGPEFGVELGSEEKALVGDFGNLHPVLVLAGEDYAKGLKALDEFGIDFVPVAVAFYDVVAAIDLFGH